jgi:DnaJ-class molecular chaperone
MTTDPELAPGDEVPAGSANAAENFCPDCGGSGVKDGDTCATCGGRGRVMEAVGGG